MNAIEDRFKSGVAGAGNRDELPIRHIQRASLAIELRR